jgi:hypothetical protein
LPISVSLSHSCLCVSLSLRVSFFSFGNAAILVT